MIQVEEKEKEERKTKQITSQNQPQKIYKAYWCLLRCRKCGKNVKLWVRFYRKTGTFKKKYCKSCLEKKDTAKIMILPRLEVVQVLPYSDYLEYLRQKQNK
jgi:hypothetical protein